MTAKLEQELRYARSAIWTVAQMGGESAKLLMQYIGWFAPPNGKLSFEQIAAHLAAVQAMFNDSTAAEWKAALRQMLADKVSGSLKMPLTNHLPLEDYLTAARAQQAHRQPENAFEVFKRFQAEIFAKSATNGASAARRHLSNQQSCIKLRHLAMSRRRSILNFRLPLGFAKVSD